MFWRRKKETRNSTLSIVYPLNVINCLKLGKTYVNETRRRSDLMGLGGFRNFSEIKKSAKIRLIRENSDLHTPRMIVTQ
jgi:hypothetical protein